jgi:hypothetical protein
MVVLLFCIWCKNDEHFSVTDAHWFTDLKTAGFLLGTGPSISLAEQGVGS